MLAVFDRTVAKPPEGLRQLETEDKSVAPGAGGVAALVNLLSSYLEGAVAISLGDAAAMAYSSAKQNPLLPRLSPEVIAICSASVQCTLDSLMEHK